MHLQLTDHHSCAVSPALLTKPAVLQRRTGLPRLRISLRTAFASALLLALSACAQTPAPPASTDVAIPNPAMPVAAVPPAPADAAALATSPAAAPTPAPAQTPAFTASNIALAFSYIDTNKDGRLSREEAAGFRGVARNFDAADANKDGALSKQEFESAMSRSKPK